MTFTVTPVGLTQAYGLSNVVYFPQYPIEGFDSRTAHFLSSVGLPNSDAFLSRVDIEDPENPETDAITLGGRFDEDGMYCPPESRSWLKLGYLFTSLVAVDPTSGKVYAFPEGSMEYILLHRDIESLVYSLIEFRKLEVGHENDVDPEQLTSHFKHAVSSFDSTPFNDEDSQWNLTLEELEHGIW